MRWPDTSGKPICPACGRTDVYNLATRRRYKCAACHRQFSVTSNTIFASRKLSFVDLLAAICLVVNASNGLSAVQLSRDLDVQHKTAFVLMHKLREVMAAETRSINLEGEVEVDGAAFGGHVRPANLRSDRVDRRILRNRSGKRRAIVVLRQRGGRTMTRPYLREAQGVDFVRERIAPGAVISADEAAHWDVLEPDFSRPGKPTDNAYIEAFNGRFRAECLNAHWFMGLEDTAEKLEAWRVDYNEERPHSAIGNKVPAALMKLPDASSPSV